MSHEHLMKFKQNQTREEFYRFEQRRAAFLADLDWASKHEFFQFDGERWVCICGCGETRERGKV
jgi:hypothetical protein